MIATEIEIGTATTLTLKAILVRDLTLVPDLMVDVTAMTGIVNPKATVAVRTADDAGILEDAEVATVEAEVVLAGDAAAAAVAVAADETAAAEVEAVADETAVAAEEAGAEAETMETTADEDVTGIAIVNL